jgi:YbbR domain-containing protein
LKDLALKVLALVLAFVLWIFVSAPRRERVSERAFAAPLSIVDMPQQLVITTPVPDTVSVRLRGRESDLRSLSSQNLEVTVDVSWAAPGEATITLRPQAINVPPGVEVLSIDPNKVRFRIEQLRQRAVSIRPFLVGQPSAGYMAGDPMMNPDQALVSGPASQVRNLSDVATERIIMTGRTETFTQGVAVVSDSPLVRIVQPMTAQVTVPILPVIGPEPLPVTGTTVTETEQDARKRKQP